MAFLDMVLLNQAKRRPQKGLVGCGMPVMLAVWPWVGYLPLGSAFCSSVVEKVSPAAQVLGLLVRVQHLALPETS